MLGKCSPTGYTSRTTGYTSRTTGVHFQPLFWVIFILDFSQGWETIWVIYDWILWLVPFLDSDQWYSVGFSRNFPVCKLYWPYVFLSLAGGIAAILFCIPCSVKQNEEGRWNGSVGKAAGCRTYWLEFDLRDLHGRRRESTSESCPLTFTLVLWCALECTCSLSHTQI